MVNVTSWTEFERTYDDVAVLHVSHNALETSLLKEFLFSVLSSTFNFWIGLVEPYGISTLVGYSTPNTF